LAPQERSRNCQMDCRQDGSTLDLSGGQDHASIALAYHGFQGGGSIEVFGREKANLYSKKTNH
jgi:hypothetical protein